MWNTGCLIAHAHFPLSLIRHAGRGRFVTHEEHGSIECIVCTSIELLESVISGSHECCRLGVRSSARPGTMALGKPVIDLSALGKRDPLENACRNK